MKQLLSKTELAISRLQADEETRAGLSKRARRYFRECGCSMGAVFLLAALGTSLLQWRYFVKTSMPSIWNVLFIIMGAIFGKLLGIAIGRLRLFILFKQLHAYQIPGSPDLQTTDR